MKTDLDARNIFTKKVPPVTVEYNKLSVMARKRDGRLGEYILRTSKEKDLTLRDIEARSGGKITHGYLSKIISGSTKNVTVDKILAIARGLGVSEEDVFDAARGCAPHAEPDFSQSDFAALFFKYRDLTSDDKAEIDRLIKLVDREIDHRMGTHGGGGPKNKK
jgi:transcriptional regulator with XRE-family HTH domain